VGTGSSSSTLGSAGSGRRPGSSGSGRRRRTIDLGCAYKLDVTPDGLVSKLSVSTGQVAFEFDARGARAGGALCESVRGRGPAAPVFESASAEFKDAVSGRVGGATDLDSVGRMIGLAGHRTR
jgi:hypothetical protein